LFKEIIVYYCCCKLKKNRLINLSKNRRWKSIPAVLKEREFNEFVLPYLKSGLRGPNKGIINISTKILHKAEEEVLFGVQGVIFGFFGKIFQ
jgi:hypothetical protein